MSAYNLGTASGRIEIDGKGASAGFKVAETAAGTFFDVINRKVESIQAMGRKMQVAGAAGVAGFGVAIKAAASFEQQMSGVKAVAGATESEFESLRAKALQLGADTSFSATEAGLAIEELAKAGIPVEDILNGAADATVNLAAAGGVALPEAATIAANAMNQFGISSDKVVNVADILAGVANTSAADVSSLGQSLSQAGAVANLAGLSFRDTAIALGEMADAGITGSDAGTSVKTMLNNLIPTTDKQSNKFKELGILQYDLGKAQKIVAREGLGQAKSMDVVNAKLEKYVDSIGMGEKGTLRNKQEVDKLLMSNGALSNSFFKANGDIKGLLGLQTELGRALKGMTKEQKLSTLETLFGADAMRASAILSLAGAKGYKEFSKAVSETSAADVAKVRLDNLSGATEAFKGSMETAMITIGNVFLPIVTKIVQGATMLVNAFNNLPGPVKTAIAIIAGIVTILLAVVGTILSSITVIALFVAQWYAMRIIGIATGYLKGFIAVQRAGLGVMAAHNAGLATATARTSRLAAITSIAGKALLLFGRTARAAWIMATGPIGIAIAAIAALVAIGVLLYNKWTPFRTLVDQIAAVLRGKLVAAWNALKPVIATVIAAFVRFGAFIKATLMPVLQQIGGQLITKLTAGWGQIKAAVASLIGPFMQLIASFRSVGGAGAGLAGALAPMGAAIGSMASVVAGRLVPILRVLGGIFLTYIIPILMKVVGFLLGVVISAVVGVVTGIMQAIKGLIQIFTGLINFVTGVFTGNWRQAWMGIKQMFTGVLNLIVGAFKVWMNVGLLKVAMVGFALLKGLFRVGWNAIRSIFMAAIRAVGSVVKGGFSLIVNIVKTYISIWRSIISAIWSFIKSIFKSGTSSMTSTVKGGFNAVVNFVKSGMKTAQSVMSSAWNAIKSVISSAWKGITNAVGDGISAMITLVRSIPGKVTSAIGNLGNTLYNAGKALIQGLINGISSMIGAIGAKMSEIGDKVKGFMPGSPVKEGPLTSWNRGAAGKRLVNLLASGLEDTSPIDKAMRSISSYVNGMQMVLEPAMMAAPVAVTAPSTALAVADQVATARGVKRRAAPPAKRSVTLQGDLVLRNGRAYITGIATDVYNDLDGYDDELDGMND